MRVARETVYGALLDLAATAAGFAGVSRDFRSWEDVPASMLPFLCMMEKSEAPAHRKGLPTVWTIDLDLVIYAGFAGKDLPKLGNLNVLLDALEVVIPAVSPGSALTTTPLTLGGLVQHCWLGGGSIEKHGWIDNLTMAIVPVQILTTD